MTDSILLKYNALNGISPQSVPNNIYSPSGCVAYPNKDDYIKGEFSRYFVKKINSHVCIETSKSEINRVDKNYYATVEISWKLTGPLESSVSSIGEKTIGVQEYNSKQIEAGQRVIPEIINILKNKSQFYRIF